MAVDTHVHRVAALMDSPKMPKLSPGNGKAACCFFPAGKYWLKHIIGFILHGATPAKPEKPECEKCGLPRCVPIIKPHKKSFDAII
jgi:endonuclease III